MAETALPDEPVDRARALLERGETANDEERLETLEELRTSLEAELEASVENDAARR